MKALSGTSMAERRPCGSCTPRTGPLWWIPVILAVSFTGCAITPDPIEPPPRPEASAVVFDIDGTLTPDVEAIFGVREGAAESVGHYADADVRVVYLSARIAMFQFLIPGWLEEEGFPEGNLQVTESSDQREDVARFKQSVLEAFMDQGWKFVAGYGDSSTDFNAYADAGIPTDRIYALKRRGEERCQPGPWVACFGSWTELRDSVIGIATEEGEVRAKP